MNKAVLIMDEMPECCADCSCGYFESGTKKLNLVCGATGEDANNVGKPEWCPLRELPERMEICGTYNAEYYAKCGLMPSYKLGWNKCLDAIEGDADKTDD